MPIVVGAGVFPVFLSLRLNDVVKDDPGDLPLTYESPQRARYQLARRGSPSNDEENFIYSGGNDRPVDDGPERRAIYDDQIESFAQGQDERLEPLRAEQVHGILRLTARWQHPNPELFVEDHPLLQFGLADEVFDEPDIFFRFEVAGSGRMTQVG